MFLTYKLHTAADLKKKKKTKTKIKCIINYKLRKKENQIPNKSPVNNAPIFDIHKNSKTQKIRKHFPFAFASKKYIETGIEKLPKIIPAVTKVKRPNTIFMAGAMALLRFSRKQYREEQRIDQ